MGMGVPVICNDIGDTGNIIQQTGTGMVVKTFDTSSLEDAVTKIPQLETLDKAHIRRSAAEYFDLEGRVKKYLGLYISLIGTAS